jgi:hypothetical protein
MALFMAALLVFTSCNDENNDSKKVTGNPVTGFTITYDDDTAIGNPILISADGGKANLKITLQPAGITGTATWTTGNSSVKVTPAAGGLTAELEGLSEGILNITVSARNSDNAQPVTRSFTVQALNPDDLPVDSLTINHGITVIPDGHEFAIYQNGNIVLDATPGPDGVLSAAVTWNVVGAGIEITPTTGLTVSVKGITEGGPFTFTVSAQNPNNITPVVRTFTAIVTPRAPVPAEWAEVGYTDFGIGKANRAINAIEYDGAGKFVAGGNNGDFVYSGYDMVWNTIPAIGGDIRAMVHVNGKFWASSHIVTPSIFTSVDGISWDRPAGGPNFGSGLGMGTDGNMRIGAVGLNSQGFAYSNDGGENWLNADLNESNWGTVRNLRGLAYGPDIAVIVGDSGGIMTAPLNDLRRGFRLVMEGVPHTGTYIDVAYGGGRFVAVGAAGQVAYSNNGTTWTAAPALSGQLNVVVYKDGFFVAGGAGGIWYSENGDTWIASTVPTGFGVFDIVYGGDKWVAVGGSGRIAYSGGIDTVRRPIRGMNVLRGNIPVENNSDISIRDGAANQMALTINLIPVEAERIITWTTPAGLLIEETATGITLTGVTPGGPHAVTLTATNPHNTATGKPAITQTLNVRVLSSDDPITIEEIVVRDGTLVINQDHNFTLNVNGTKSLAIELVGPFGIEADGDITWESDDPAVSVEPADDGLSAVLRGESVTTAPVTITISAENALNPGDPVTFTFTVIVARPPSGWTTTGVTAFGTGGADTSSVDGVAFGNGVWVAGGRHDGNAIIRYSPDGKTTWLGSGTDEDTSLTFAGTGTGALPATAIRSVIFDGTRFVAGDASGRVFTSTNGKDWSEPKPTGLTGVITLSYGGGKYIATGFGSTDRFSWSSDLIDWVTPAANATGAGAGHISRASAYGIVNGQDTWVFIFGNGVVRVTNELKGIDDTVFESGTTGVTVNLTSVTFGNGRFVIVGASGTVLQSLDGLTWSPALTSFGTGGQNIVIFSNGYFVAGGDSHSLRFSADGMTWTTANTSGGNPNCHIRSISFGNNIWHAGGRGANLFFSDVSP